MASDPRELTVVYTRQADRELRDIWDWNAKERGAMHATKYVRNLEAKISWLGTNYLSGRPVKHFPELRQLLIKQSGRGHFHIVIYEIDELGGAVYVLHVYHERQDTQGRLAREGR